MKKWMTRAAAGLLAALLLLGGCKAPGEGKTDSESQSTAYSIYYVNADETELVRSSYEPGEETRDVMVQEMMQLLKDQESNEDRLTLLPEGVYITTYDIHEKTLTIDFNSAYLDMSREREVLVRGGIVRMFIQVPGILYVHFTVEGEELTDSRGEEIGPMNSDSFVDQAGRDINSYQYATLTLYFSNETGDRLIQEKRSMYYNSNVALERVVVEQLLEGPRNAGSSAVLPSGTNILGVTSADGTCYVNLDQTFTESTLALQESIPVYAIVNSLVDTCGVDKVQISINGETDVTFRETMRLDRFYEKDASLVEESEEEQEEESREETGEEETAEENAAEENAAEEGEAAEAADEAQARAADIVTAAPAETEAAGK